MASQVVSGPNGWSTAPCASDTSSQWSFAGGSTASGNTLTLSLFNPSATEAVVNVSFLTANGGVTPQSYQGVMVPPGQLVEENVGDYVQNESAIGTSVASQSGTLVATEFEQWSSGATGGLSLQLGSPALSSTWRFAQTTALQGSTVDLTLANPGAAPVEATVSVGLASGTVVPRQLVVPSSSSAVFVALGIVRAAQTGAVFDHGHLECPDRRRALGPGTGGGVDAGVGLGLGDQRTRRAVVGTGAGHHRRPGTANATVTSLAVANPGLVHRPGDGDRARFHPAGGDAGRRCRPARRPRSLARRWADDVRRLGRPAGQRGGGQRAFGCSRCGVVVRVPLRR